MIISKIQQLKSQQYSSGLKVLKTGTMVTLKVLSGTAPSWQGSIKGKLLHFSSCLPLKPGELLHVLVQWSGKDLILKHMPPEKQVYSRFIAQNAIPDNEISRRVLEQLRMLQIPFSDALFSIVYQKLEKSPASTKRTIQLLLLMAEKGFAINPEDAEAIQLYLFSPGNHMLNRRQQDILKMFNSVSSKYHHWLFCAFEQQKMHISGKIGIRYTVQEMRSDYIVFLLEENGNNWIFCLDETNPLPFMGIFSGKKKISSFEKSEIALLLEKLNRIGIKTDKTVNNADQFLLFSTGKRGKTINELA